MVSRSPADNDWAGYRAMLSPEWTPARSTCSMMPGISTSLPSHTASTSISTPSRYLSTSSGLRPEMSLAMAANERSSAASRQISILGSVDRPQVRAEQGKAGSHQRLGQVDRRLDAELGQDRRRHTGDGIV